MATTATRYYWTPAQKADFVHQYVEQDASINDIAAGYGVSYEAIRYHLCRAGVQLRKAGCQTERAKDKQRGQNHHSWRGGRYRRSTGYWYLLVPEHPRVNRDGYVPEHRLVVERHLLATDPRNEALRDGLLRRSYVVHHKNHDKGDNRVENLEAMPKKKHTPMLHFLEEIARLKKLVGEAA